MSRDGRILAHLCFISWHYSLPFSITRYLLRFYSTDALTPLFSAIILSVISICITSLFFSGFKALFSLSYRYFIHLKSFLKFLWRVFQHFSASSEAQVKLYYLRSQSSTFNLEHCLTITLMLRSFKYFSLVQNSFCVRLKTKRLI